MKKTVLLLLILAGIVLKVSSQGNLPKEEVDSCYTIDTCYSSEDQKIIALTFNENNYLRQRVDSLEDLGDFYKNDISFYRKRDIAQEERAIAWEELAATQGRSISRLSKSYDAQLKELKKSKILNGVVIGGVAVSIGALVYLLVIR